LNEKEKKVLLIAHRGASSVAPANTLKAFSKAIELGADYIEFDIHQTKDRPSLGSRCRNPLLNSIRSQILSPKLPSIFGASEILNASILRCSKMSDSLLPCGKEF
jgi:hypothetical protein